MKILIIALNFTPELTGIGKYVGEMSEWLGQAEFDVRVVAAPPYYPAWRIASGYSAGRYRCERDGRRTIYRCPLYVPSRPTGPRRLVHLLSFALTSLPVVLWQAIRWRPDIVFVVEPPLFCAPVALAAARLSGARAWLHVQDFELDAAFALGLLRARRARQLAAAAERWLISRFDRVSTISAAMLARLADKGVAAARRVMFPNWADVERVHPAARVNALRHELAIPDRAQVLLYSGNLGNKQGLEILIEAARRLRAREDLLFVVCGDGPSRAALVEASAGLRNMRFIPLQPVERFNELMNLADIHLLPQRADAEDLVMPSKLTAMLASGRPVIVTASPESELARTASPAGLVVAPGDANGFAAAIVELAADEPLRVALGTAGRRVAVERWDRGRVLATAFGRESLMALLDSAAANG